MHMNIHNPDWRKRAGARLMPWFEGAVVVLTLLWALVWLVMIVAAIGFYLLCAAIVIPVCVLVMRLGGWKIDWLAWIQGKRK
jgi:hypothetical protein